MIHLPFLADAMGFIGTSILLFSSYSLEPPTGSQFGFFPEEDKAIKRKNKLRKKGQRIGFFLLCVSFFISGALHLNALP